MLLDQGSRRAGRLAALGAMLALTGCGGGGNDGGGDNEPPPPPAPAIQQFSADRVRYDVGDVAKLTVRFSGGAGRIDPGIGAVTDGASVDTPPLDVTTS